MDLKSVTLSCRLCFSECASDSVNIFDEGLRSPTYSAQVMEMFQIEVPEQLNWPTSACGNCVAQLEEIRRLKISIGTAQSLIREALQNVSIKTERETKSEIDRDVPIELWCSPEWIKDEPGDKDAIKEDEDEEDNNAQADEEDEDEDSNADGDDSKAEEDEMEYQPESDSEDGEEDNDDIEEMIEERKSISGSKKLHPTEKIKRLVARTNAKKTDEIRELEEMMRSKGLLTCKLCLSEEETYMALWCHVRTCHKKEVSKYVFCCTRILGGSTLIFDHMRVHKDPDIFKCRLCHLVLQSSMSLKSHEQHVHKNGEIKPEPKKRRPKCSPLSPEEIEKALKKLRKKRKTTKDEQNETLKPFLQEFSLLNCLECEQEQVNIVDLWIHHLEVHKQAPVIECCNKKFFDIKMVHEHMRYHQSPESSEFKCEICHSKFLTHVQKRSHVSSAHPAGQTACDICGALFRRKDSLRTHKLRHLSNDQRAHKCTECGKGFITKSSLKEHIAAVHDREGTILSYICEQCGKAFRTSGNLKAHTLSRHDPEYMAKYDAKHKVLVPCDQCGKMMRRVFLKKHKEKSCKASGVIHKCHICGKEYNWRRSLSVHITNMHFPKNPSKRHLQRKADQLAKSMGT